MAKPAFSNMNVEELLNALNSGDNTQIQFKQNLAIVSILTTLVKNGTITDHYFNELTKMIQEEDNR